MNIYKIYENKTGFTLLEIIVGTIVLLIGITCVSALILWARLVLRVSENKAKAMNVAFSKMEEYLAKSYSRIGTLDGKSPDADPNSIEKYSLGWLKEGLLFREKSLDTDKNPISWQVNVYQEYEGDNEKLPNPSSAPQEHKIIPIPYKKIEVIARYQEENPARQGTFFEKAVRLLAVVPYPALHAMHKERSQDKNVLAPYLKSPPTAQNHPEATLFSIDLGTVLVSETQYPSSIKAYETPKELLIIYNIGIKVENLGELFSNPSVNPGVYTLYTACYVDDKGPLPVVTRTPLLSQPLVNNVVALTGKDSLTVPQDGKPHKLQIKWWKDTDQGKISLRSANVIILAFEEQ
ncbi:MAG: type II secretion system GspH family protein [Candidatus Omnitrophica bacterium]|nr:type II secretion system GspH family protein [Candidatus Omnitrophota bacterium]